MLSFPTIAISPHNTLENESDMINQLLEAGLHRYHIHKTVATEQSIAEILEGVELKYLSRITLHSHFHLVLAYGVGGIHYSLDHRKMLGKDYESKVQLYQGFGVKVSTDIDQSDWSPADYGISTATDIGEKASVYYQTNNLKSIQSIPSALVLEEVIINQSIEDIVTILKESTAG